jgi:hypothetical protein
MICEGEAPRGAESRARDGSRLDRLTQRVADPRARRERRGTFVPAERWERQEPSRGVALRNLTRELGAPEIRGVPNQRQWSCPRLPLPNGWRLRGRAGIGREAIPQPSERGGAGPHEAERSNSADRKQEGGRARRQGTSGSLRSFPVPTPRERRSKRRARTFVKPSSSC